MESNVLVTGAAGGTQGATGHRLTVKLREKGLPVRAFVHREDERSDELKGIGADIVAGDLLDIQTVRKAMKGIGRIYFCYPVREGLLDATAIMAEVAKEERATFILNLSQGSAADDSPSRRARRHWLSEKIFDWSGVPTLHLRGGVFYENLVRQFAEGIREDSELRAPFGSGNGKIPAIAAEDVSRLALVALQHPEQFSGKTLMVFGSILSLNDIAQELTKILSRSIHYKQVSPEDWIKEAEIREGKQNPEQIDHLVNLWKGILITNQNASMASRLSELGGLFQKLTGESPLSLGDWFKLNQAALV